MRLFVLVCWAAAALAAETPGFHLSDDVVPTRYQAMLAIDPNKDNFEASTTIWVKIAKPSSTLWLNGKDLTPESAEVFQGSTRRNARAKTVGKEFIEIEVPGDPLSGEWAIYLTYRGRIDEKSVYGLYRRKIDGNWYAYTTFTPIEARRVFPCFDEPRFKTPWEISIKVPPGERAFANAAQRGSVPEPDGDTTVRFEPTRPLPSELIAFAVGPFDVYQGKPAGHDTPIRVIAPKGLAAQGQPAAEGAVAVLPRLEEYTGIPYAFGKLDNLAEAEGEFGAVENPGLIVYLARELLVPPGAETVSAIHALRLLEAHEMGHQWFGDLVTQATWSDVWLSEGFATWISEKVMDEFEKPDRSHLELIDERERVMQTDDSRRTRAVRVEPKDRDGTRDIYNRFVYDKGASVLLMLEGWVGEDKLRKGVLAYLNAHRFGNATTADLATALKAASGIDPTSVLHSFLDLTGLPRVSIDVECKPTPRLKIRQTGASAIPVCYRGPGVQKSCVVVEGPSRDVDLPPGSSCPSWIEPNAGGTGYYRSTWSTPQLTALSLEALSPAERLTLAFDLRALAADRPAAHATLVRLANDAVPEVAAAAQEGVDKPKPNGRGSSR